MRSFAAAILMLLASMLPVHAQAPSQEPIEVMLLGTVHLDNPGRDLNNPRVPDVLAPRKQEELQALRDSLAQFQPTKIGIEIRREHQAAVDSLYGAFRAGRMDSSFAVGDFTSVRSEQYQIGYRIAKRLTHKRIYAVDYFEVGMNFEEVIAFAKKHDPAFLKHMKRFQSGPLMTTIDSLLQNETLGSLYRYLNRPSTVTQFRAPNTRVATVGEDTTYVGADVVAQYYKRNLRIFANIEDVAEPGDRILVIFGAGHLPYLRPLIEASPQMEFVDPLDYL
jgi:hypothetical protein